MNKRIKIFTKFSNLLPFCPLRTTHLGHRLRSTSSTDFALPQLRTKFGESAFSHAGFAAWNSLPEHIRAETDIRVFKKLLKTHLSNLSFNIH